MTYTTATTARTRGALDLITRHLAREIEHERRYEAEYKAEGRDRLAEYAHERAFAYECAMAFVEGVISTTGTSC